LFVDHQNVHLCFLVPTTNTLLLFRSVAIHLSLSSTCL
jgi:hypothetical protein